MTKEKKKEKKKSIHTDEIRVQLEAKWKIFLDAFTTNAGSLMAKFLQITKYAKILRRDRTHKFDV